MATTTNASTATWGVTSVDGGIGSVTGVVISLEITESLIETPPIQNEVGTVQFHAFYDKRKTATATIVCKNTQKLPDIDTEITIDNNKFYITDMAISESNQDWTKVSLSLESYTNCTKVTKEYTTTGA